MIAHSAARDRAWGRFLARRGAARVLTEAEHAPSMDARRGTWYSRYCCAGLHRTSEHLSYSHAGRHAGKEMR